MCPQERKQGLSKEEIIPSQSPKEYSPYFLSGNENWWVFYFKIKALK